MPQIMPPTWTLPNAQPPPFLLVGQSVCGKVFDESFGEDDMTVFKIVVCWVKVGVE